MGLENIAFELAEAYHNMLNQRHVNSLEFFFDHCFVKDKHSFDKCLKFYEQHLEGLRKQEPVYGLNREDQIKAHKILKKMSLYIGEI